MNETFVEQLACAFRKVGTIHTVGEEWHSYTGEIPVGGVPYCGQMVTRATYSALWKYAQEKYLVLDEANWQMYAEANGGNVPFYSSGDGSTTFRMPRIVGYVKGASSQSEAGTHLFEGLPNITGTAHCTDMIPTADQVYTGAFYASGNIGSKEGAGSYSNNADFAFDASRSSPIYGNSDHVTPETSVVLFGVYAFGAIVETGALDATTLATGLARVESNIGSLEANKLDKSAIHVVETWSSERNWYRKWSDGWIEQGGRVYVDSTMTTVTLHTPFKNAQYTVLCTSRANYNLPVIQDMTGTTFQLDYVNNEYGNCYWYACGY